MFSSNFTAAQTLGAPEWSQCPNATGNTHSGYLHTEIYNVLPAFDFDHNIRKTDFQTYLANTSVPSACSCSSVPYIVESQKRAACSRSLHLALPQVAKTHTCTTHALHTPLFFKWTHHQLADMENHCRKLTCHNKSELKCFQYDQI